MVLCAVVMLHGAVMTFFASSVQTVVPSQKEDTMQMVGITAQLLELTEPAQTFPEVKAPAAAAPAPLPAAVAQALPKVESRAVPEQRPAEVAQALPEPPLQAVPSPRERPTPELAESAASPS